MLSINWNTVYGIAGILGLLIGIIGAGLTFYSIKRIKRSCQLKFVPEKCFNIFNTLSDKFTNFKIQYNGRPKNHNISYISGKLLCTKQDINSQDNSVEIELISDDYKWIDLSVDTSNNKITAKINKDDNSPRKAILKFNKIRNKEYLIISAIVECAGQEQLSFEDIRFSHRIDNTDDIIVETLKEPANNFQNILKKIVFLVLLTICAFVAFLGVLLLSSKYDGEEGIMFFLAGIFGYIFLCYSFVTNKTRRWFWNDEKQRTS